MGTHTRALQSRGWPGALRLGLINLMPKMKRDDLENSFDLNLLKILLERSCCSIGHSDKTSVLDKVFKISVALGHENTGELLECWLLNAEKCMNLLMNESNEMNPVLMRRAAMTLCGSCQLLGLETLADLCLTVDYRTMRIDSFYKRLMEKMTFEVRNAETIFGSVLKFMSQQAPKKLNCAPQDVNHHGVFCPRLDDHGSSGFKHHLPDT
jgi:hypothetical protein